MTTKRCSKCHAQKNPDQFHKNRCNADGLANRCRPCNLEGNAEYRKRPENQARRKITRGTGTTNGGGLDYYEKLYGINKSQFDALNDQQGGLCAICGLPEIIRTRLACDHDHLNGQVRGLLCHQCNVGLGSFKDDPTRLNSAIDYLNRTPSVTENHQNE